MSSIKKYTKFAVYWLVNVVLLYFATSLFPGGFKLGNNHFSMFQAAMFTGFVWGVAIWHAEGFFKSMDINTKNEKTMMFTYLALNFVTLWLLARFAVLTGFGAMSYLYVLGLAVVGNLVQYGVWKYLDKK